VDYAGVFPPASLPLDQAVANYGRYRTGANAWMLGRLVIPAARLGDVACTEVAQTSAVRVSATLGDDIEAGFDAVERVGNALRVEAVEVRAANVDAVARIVRRARPGMRVFAEVSANDDGHVLDALAEARVSAKIRTGGVTDGAIPPADDVVRFVSACYARDIAFKATAGLHHPLRGEHPLTYEPGSPVGMMFGFLNLLLMAAFLTNGMNRTDAMQILQKDDLTRVEFRDDGISWREYSLSTNEVQRTRLRLALSVGSCSFDEPVAGLKLLNLLD